MQQNGKCAVPPTNHESKLQISESLLSKSRSSTSDESDITLKSCPESKKMGPNQRLRYMLTGAVACGFLAMGLSLSSFGLALPTLAENVKLPSNEVSPAVVVRGLGFVMGSLICGALEKKLSLLILLISSLLLFSVGLFFTPIILNPVALYCFVYLSAVGMGGFETVASVLVLHMWGAKSEPVLQFLHFWLCLGSAVLPFVMEPFLNDERNYSDVINNTFNESVYRPVVVVDGTSLPLLSVPYFIFAVFLLLIVSFILITIPCWFMSKSNSKQENTIENEGKIFRVTLLALLFFFCLLYVGAEVSFLTFLYTFGLSEAPGMRMTKELSAYLSAVLYFSVVLGQFFAIFMSRIFTPAVILRTDLLGMAFASTVLLFLPKYASVAPQVFWVGIGLLGLFTASIYGTIFLWAERYITVNARAACVFVIGGSVGEMILPLPVGFVIEEHPMWLLYFNYIYTSLLILLFIFMVKFASTKGERLLGYATSQKEEELTEDL